MMKRLNITTSCNCCDCDGNGKAWPCIEETETGDYVKYLEYQKLEAGLVTEQARLDWAIEKIFNGFDNEEDKYNALRNYRISIDKMLSHNKK